MITAEQIWLLIDRMAEREKLSRSALASLAGFDRTSFNPSKRVRPDGMPRWPSTEVIARLLDSTGTDASELGAMLAPSPPVPQRLPCADLDGLSSGDFDENGFHAGEAWRRIPFTERGHPRTLAFRVTDKSLEPVFPQDSVLIAAPARRPDPGDRLIMVPREGPAQIRHLTARPPRAVTVRPVVGDGDEVTIPLRDIRWLYRIRWCQY